MYSPKPKRLRSPVLKILVFGGLPSGLPADDAIAHADPRGKHFQPLEQLRAYELATGERILMIGGLPDEHLPMARDGAGVPLPDKAQTPDKQVATDVALSPEPPHPIGALAQSIAEIADQ